VAVRRYSTHSTRPLPIVQSCCTPSLTGSRRSASVIEATKNEAWLARATKRLESLGSTRPKLTTEVDFDWRGPSHSQRLGGAPPPRLRNLAVRFSTTGLGRYPPCPRWIRSSHGSHRPSGSGFGFGSQSARNKRLASISSLPWLRRATQVDHRKRSLPLIASIRSGHKENAWQGTCAMTPTIRYPPCPLDSRPVVAVRNPESQNFPRAFWGFPRNAWKGGEESIADLGRYLNSRIGRGVRRYM
jgi:hypothetical protein